MSIEETNDYMFCEGVHVAHCDQPTDNYHLILQFPSALQSILATSQQKKL